MVEALRPFRVGEWNVVPSAQRIERGPERIRLGPTAMDVLVTLAQRAGDVVTREEILEAVWSGTFVGDEVVSNAIWELRRALGDDAQSPRYIQTLPKKGYRLVATVSRSNHRALRSVAWKWLAVGAAVLLSAVVGTLATRAPRSFPVPVRLTSLDGRERDPALSPDERRIAFGTDSELYVVSAEGGEPLLLSAVDGGFGSAAWSADGEWIAFSHRGRDHSGSGEIRVLRALGGSERHVATTKGYRRDIDWSPDGRWLAASSKESELDPHSIYLYAVDTGEKRRVSHPPEGTGMSGDSQPRFSPDGTRIGFLRWTEAIYSSSDIYVQPFGETNARRVTVTEGRMDSFDWLPDGSGLVASMDEKLFHVPLDSGELVPLPFGEGAGDVSAGRDRLVYRGGRGDSDIWRIPGPAAEAGAERASWITSNARDIWPEYSPDGQSVLFMSDRTGSFELWVCNASERNRNCRQRTSSDNGAGNGSCPDGRWIAFVGDLRSPTPGVYLMDAAGGDPVRLTAEGEHANLPSWSRDGGKLYFTVGAEDSPELWQISLPSRKRSRIEGVRGGRPRASGDGRFVYYSKWLDLAPIARVPLAGGGEKIVLDKRPGYVDWDIWEGRLVYLLHQQGSIETLDLETGRTEDVLELPADFSTRLGFTVSPDGKWILLTKQEAQFDVMLVENYLSAIVR